MEDSRGAAATTRSQGNHVNMVYGSNNVRHRICVCDGTAGQRRAQTTHKVDVGHDLVSQLAVVLEDVVVVEVGGLCDGLAVLQDIDEVLVG